MKRGGLAGNEDFQHGGGGGEQEGHEEDGDGGDEEGGDGMKEDAEDEVHSDEEDEDELAGGGETGGEMKNRCDLLWQGFVARRVFHGFRFQVIQIFSVILYEDESIQRCDINLYF